MFQNERSCCAHVPHISNADCQGFLSLFSYINDKFFRFGGGESELATVFGSGDLKFFVAFQSAIEGSGMTRITSLIWHSFQASQAFGLAFYAAASRSVSICARSVRPRRLVSCRERFYRKYRWLLLKTYYPSHRQHLFFSSAAIERRQSYLADASPPPDVGWLAAWPGRGACKQAGSDCFGGPPDGRPPDRR